MAKKRATGFGRRLRELRAAAGLTQAQLAERAEMHLHGLTKLEQGDREPSWATVQDLARALGVSCEAFQEDSAKAPAEDLEQGRSGRAGQGKAGGQARGKGRKGKGE
jgi:transcriptional regulator with XRE-family HTH domain